MVSIIHSQNPYIKGVRRFLLSLPPVQKLVWRSYMDDKAYITYMYEKYFGEKPNLDNPKNFNEKNNWRKLHDRKPEYTSLVDKYLVKDVVKRKVGRGHTIPLLGVWDNPKEIDFDALPNMFVLKTNHSEGGVIVKDKNQINVKNCKKTLKRQLRIDYFIQSREWPYKNVERKIIAEQYMGENLVDYKNYCFNGKVLYTLVWKNINKEDGSKPEAYFCGAYDRNWEKTSMELDYESLDEVAPKPDGYEEMIRIAETMSEGIPFVRCDCYCIDGKVYVGEMTFFPWGGFQKFKDEEWNEKLGQLEIL